MSRYFGVLSSHSKWRRQIVIRPHVKKGFTGSGTGTARMSWSKLLQRVFKIDIDRCRVCQGKLNPDQCEVVTSPLIVSAILRALGLLGCAPVWAPPRGFF